MSNENLSKSCADLDNDADLTGVSETDARFEDIPHSSPIKPVQLSLDDTFQFRCHKDIDCFNECCKSIEIQLTPYDIVRLKQHFGISSNEFVSRYTMPFEMDAHGMPGLRLATQAGNSASVFLTDQECGVYQDRPSACRYYALGNMAVRKKESNQVEDVFFVVKENHCHGHNEPHTQTVREYLAEQGLEAYEGMNREWRDIVIKKRSSGPTIGKPSDRSLQLFDMCSYDMDSFRNFLQSPGFGEVFDIDAAFKQQLLNEDTALLAFAMRFLKQVLFGENTIDLKPNAREARVEKRQAVWEQRKHQEIQSYQEQQQDDMYDSLKEQK